MQTYRPIPQREQAHNDWHWKTSPRITRDRPIGYAIWCIRVLYTVAHVTYSSRYMHVTGVQRQYIEIWQEWPHRRLTVLRQWPSRKVSGTSNMTCTLRLSSDFMNIHIPVSDIIRSRTYRPIQKSMSTALCRASLIRQSDTSLVATEYRRGTIRVLSRVGLPWC